MALESYLVQERQRRFDAGGGHHGRVLLEGKGIRDQGASFGVENATTIGSATGGAGEVRFNEFTIKRTTDKSSPLLFKNCCVGAHYGLVIIAIRKAGGDPATAGRYSPLQV